MKICRETGHGCISQALELQHPMPDWLLSPLCQPSSPCLALTVHARLLLIPYSCTPFLSESLILFTGWLLIGMPFLIWDRISHSWLPPCVDSLLSVFGLWIPTSCFPSVWTPLFSWAGPSSLCMDAFFIPLELWLPWTLETLCHAVSPCGYPSLPSQAQLSCSRLSYQGPPPPANILFLPILMVLWLDCLEKEGLVFYCFILLNRNCSKV